METNLLGLALLAVPFFIAIDGVWLGTQGEKLYRKALGKRMAKKPDWGIAAAFYVVFIAGLAYFAIEPAVAQDSWRVGLERGALYGLVTYGTYGLTNGATLEDWPKRLMMIDLAWGIFISAAVSTLTAAAWLAWF